MKKLSDDAEVTPEEEKEQAEKAEAGDLKDLKL